MGPGVSSVSSGATAGSARATCVGGAPRLDQAQALVSAVVPRLNPDGGQGDGGPPTE
jgi:hypothetical protein